MELTKTRGEELRVEVGEELLTVRIELAHSCNDIAGETDADDLHNGFEDEQCEIGEVGVRSVLVPERMHEAIVAVVVGLRGHGCESGGAGLEVAQAQGLGRSKEGHF